MRGAPVRGFINRLLASQTSPLSSPKQCLVNTLIVRGHCRANSAVTGRFSLPGCQVLGANTLLFSSCNRSSIVTEQKRYITEDRQTTALTIWKDLKHLKSSPMPALVLGLSGLIPFVAPPLGMFYLQTFSAQLVYAQMAYGACILSFLGGVRWGFVIPEESVHQANWLNLGYSVAPSLVAWVGLLLPVNFGILTVMSGIAAAAYFDATMGGYPPWFKALRFLLSLGAVLSLWTGFLCKFVLKEKDTKVSQPVKNQESEQNK